MNTILQPILELTVIIPGMLLTYLPVRSYLHTGSHKSFSDAGTDHADPAFLNLLLWLVPLLAIVSILGGAICYHWNLSTAWILFPLLLAFFCFITRHSGSPSGNPSVYFLQSALSSPV